MTRPPAIPRPRRSSAAQRAALAVAESRCHSLGEVWTAARSKTYELLLDAGGSRSAYDLISGLKRSAYYVRPPTIYRALDFLIKAGLAHRVESQKGYVACAAPNSPHTGATFLICEACGRTDEQPLDLDPLVGAPRDFAVHSVILEIHGVCLDCR